MTRLATRRQRFAAIASTFALAGTVLVGCGAAGDATAASSATTSAAASSSTTSTTSTSAAETTATAIDTHYDEDDLTWDTSQEVAVTLADGESSAASGATVDGDTVTITEGGVYRISGTLSDGQVVVAAPEDQSVTLILDNATITNSSGSAISVLSADEVTIFLAESSTNARG